MNQDFISWLIKSLGEEDTDHLTADRNILGLLERARAANTTTDSLGTLLGWNNVQRIIRWSETQSLSSKQQQQIEALRREAIGQVFISYARADNQYAEGLERDLNNAGIATWRDKRNLDYGQDFSGEIELGIRNSTHVVVCLTPDVQRPDSFVRREIAYALGRRKPVIPLLYPGGELTVQISTWTYIDMEGKKSFGELINRLYSPANYQQPYQSGANTPALIAYLNILHHWASEQLDESVHTLITLAASSSPHAVKAPESMSVPALGFNYVVSPAIKGIVGKRTRACVQT